MRVGVPPRAETMQSPPSPAWSLWRRRRGRRRRGSAEGSRMRGGAGERGTQNRLRRGGRRGAPPARRRGDPSHESSVERIMWASAGKRDCRKRTGMPPSRWKDSNPRRRQRRSMHRPEEVWDSYPDSASLCSCRTDHPSPEPLLLEVFLGWPDSAFISVERIIRVMSPCF